MLFSCFSHGSFVFSAKPNREHIFHVKFPDTWTQGDLNNLFRKFGPVSTRWIDSSSAFVVLLHRENVPAVLPTIEKPRTVQVITFEAFSKTASIEFDEVSHQIQFNFAKFCAFVIDQLNTIKKYALQEESDDDEQTGSSVAAKRPCIEITSNPRWNFRLIVLAIVIAVLFFIIPDFIILWELQFRKPA